MMQIVIPAQAGISARKGAALTPWDPAFRRSDGLGGNRVNG